MKARKMTKLIGLFLVAVMTLTALLTVSVIPAFAEECNNHKAGAIFDYDGTQHWLLCEYCGEPVESTRRDHIAEKDCSVCGWEYRSPEDLYKQIARLELAVDELESSVDASTAQLSTRLQSLLVEIKQAKNDMKVANQAHMNTLNDLLDKATTALEKAIDELAARMTTAEGNISDQQILIKAAREAIAALEKDSATKVELNALKDALEKADAALEKKINALTAALDAAKNDLTTADGKLDEKISKLSAALNAAKDALEQADEDDKAELTAAIASAKDSLNASIKAVQKNLDDAKAALKSAMELGDDQLETKIAALNTATKDLEAALAAAEAALEGADESNKDELEGVIKSVQNTLKEAIGAGDAANKEALEKEIKALREEIEQTKSDAQVVPIVIACIAIVGDIAILWVVILKRKRFMGMSA